MHGEKEVAPYTMYSLLFWNFCFCFGVYSDATVCLRKGPVACYSFVSLLCRGVPAGQQ